MAIETSRPDMHVEPSKHPMNYLITGAGGFVGHHLISRLLKAGHSVVGCDLTRPSNLPEGAVFAACDIRDRTQVEAAFAVTSIDYVVHLAACVGDWGERAVFEATNIGGTENVLSVALANGVKRAIHTSSIVVMGYDPGYSADEAVGPVAQGDIYTDTKAEAENVALRKQREGAPIVIIRPGDVYGVGCEPWVNRPVRMMEKGQLVWVDGGAGHFANTYVDNLIDGILLAINHPDAVGETYIITDGVDSTTFKSYMSALAVACGVRAPRFSVPMVVARLLATLTEATARIFGFKPPMTRPALRFVSKRCSYSITKAQKQLGYAPRVDLAEGLARIREGWAGPE